MIQEDEWLVVIDRQRVFCESDWSTWACADHTYDSTTEAFTKLAKAYGNRVIYTRYVAPLKPENAWVDYFKDWPQFLVKGECHKITICGVATDCCVLTTALAAADNGVAVRIAEDACAGSTPENHKLALKTMELFTPLITVCSTSEIL